MSNVHSTSAATGRLAFGSYVRKDQWNLLHHPISDLFSGQKVNEGRLLGRTWLIPPSLFAVSLNFVPNVF
jgi:hypothetical protein